MLIPTAISTSGHRVEITSRKLMLISPRLDSKVAAHHNQHDGRDVAPHGEIPCV